MMTTIHIVPPGDALAQEALALVQEHALLSWVTLFGGDRWSEVARCAVAINDAGQPVALATLAPTDELREGGPHIIGLWVAPAYRRRRIALTLVGLLAQESRRLYHRGAVMLAVTSAAVALANKLYEENIPVDCINAGDEELP